MIQVVIMYRMHPVVASGHPVIVEKVAINVSEGYWRISRRVVFGTC